MSIHERRALEMIADLQRLREKADQWHWESLFASLTYFIWGLQHQFGLIEEDAESEDTGGES